MSRPVAFVGPLPPPLHGFSSVCSMMLLRLQKGGAVEVFDRAPRGHGRASALLQQLRAVLRYTATLRGSPHCVVYLGLSGGLGQAIDALYVVAARMLRRQVYVHHHSYAYLNRPSPISRVVFWLLRDAVHIVLSDGMGAALAQRYRISDGQIRVVSNAAFLGPPPPLEVAEALVVAPPMTAESPPPGASPPGALPPIRIGFLSNITFDKGLVEFFDVLTQLRQRSVAYQATIAGPVAADAQATFDRLLGAAEQVDYVGPVYDEAKSAFYRRLDILLFPTRYANEAEPLVVHEALRCGVYVFACARGAIAELLANGAGTVFDQAGYVTSTAAGIAQLAGDRAQRLRVREQAFTQAQRLQLRAEAELGDLIRQIHWGAATTDAQ